MFLSRARNKEHIHRNQDIYVLSDTDEKDDADDGRNENNTELRITAVLGKARQNPFWAKPV